MFFFVFVSVAALLTTYNPINDNQLFSTLLGLLHSDEGVKLCWFLAP